MSALLTALRAELLAEAPAKLHAHSTAAVRDYDGVVRDPDQGGIGPPFSVPFLRFLDWHWDQPPMLRLGMASIIEVSDWCASRHPDHRRPGERRALCGQLVYEAGYLAQEPEQVAWLHAMTVLHVRRLLNGGLRHAADFRHRQRHAFERRSQGYIIHCGECPPDGTIVRMRAATA